MSLIFAALASACYGYLYDVPLKALIVAALAGASGWGAFLVTDTLGHSVAASLAGSLVVALIAQLASSRIKMPVTTMVVPGILPLVPGTTSYRAVLYSLEGDYLMGMALGVRAVAITGAIAMGLIIVDMLGRRMGPLAGYTTILPKRSDDGARGGS